MTEALRKSIDQCGIDIVNSYQRLRAILSDFLPGANNKFERKFLLDALELDEWHILLETHDKGQMELSISEVIHYFGDSGDLTKRPDNRWMTNGKSYLIDDKFCFARIAKYNGEKYAWWLRSPGCGREVAADVGIGGTIAMSGNFVSDGECGVRPALWLNL
jgi:hypothetical protein